MMLAPQTFREKVLLGVSLVVACGMGYVLFRYRPMQQMILKAQVEAAGAHEKIAAIQWPEEPAREPDDLDKELSQIRLVIAKQELAIRRLEGRFVRKELPQAQQELKLRISELSERCGIRILESSRHTLARGVKPQAPSVQAAQGAVIDHLVEGGFFPRPMQKLEIESTFEGLRQFVRGLEQLPWQVVPVEFQTTVMDKTADLRGKPVLRSTLVLAL